MRQFSFAIFQRKVSELTETVTIRSRNSRKLKQRYISEYFRTCKQPPQSLLEIEMSLRRDLLATAQALCKGRRDRENHSEFSFPVRRG